MRLPSTLLGRVRVGVGVGAVMLGGCDLVDEAKARVLGSESAPAASVAEASEPESEPAAEAAPEPMLMDRGGVASVVQEVAESRPRSNSEPEPIEPLSQGPRPIDDLARSTEPGSSSAFVPYEDGAGSLAAAPSTLARPEAPRPKRRVKRRRPRQIAVDEPCDPGVKVATAPDRPWECLACGRG